MILYINRTAGCLWS